MLVNALFFGVLALLFLGMVATQIAGHHYGVRRASGDSGASSEGTAAVEATLFAMLGLLVAFTFSGADTRLDARRKLIIEETNAVGTAYLRLDLLRAEDEPILQDDVQSTSTLACVLRTALRFPGGEGRARPLGSASAEDLDRRGGGERQGRISRATLLVLQSLNAISMSRPSATPRCGRTCRSPSSSSWS